MIVQVGRTGEREEVRWWSELRVTEAWSSSFSVVGGQRVRGCGVDGEFPRLLGVIG